MYDFIGQKIKGLAKVLGWLCLIAGIIAWIYFITNGYTRNGGTYMITSDDFIGWIALISGGIGFCSSWFLYGFGQLVEDVGEISYYLQHKKED